MNHAVDGERRDSGCASLIFSEQVFRGEVVPALGEDVEDLTGCPGESTAGLADRVDRPANSIVV